MVKLLISNIVTAFDLESIGTKVTDHDEFTAGMLKAIEKHQFATEDNPEAHEVKGQAFILTPSLVPFVSSGDAPRVGAIADSIGLTFTRDVANSEGALTAEQIRESARTLLTIANAEHIPEDPAYVSRIHRGETHRYLRRTADLPAPEFCALVVYTIDAYLRDPDVLVEPGELERAMLARADEHVTHCLVAVLGSVGPKPSLSPYRFLANVAGGNLKHCQADAEALTVEAWAILDYTASWVTVAD